MNFQAIVHFEDKVPSETNITKDAEVQTLLTSMLTALSKKDPELMREILGHVQTKEDASINGVVC